MRAKREMVSVVAQWFVVLIFIASLVSMNGCGRKDGKQSGEGDVVPGEKKVVQKGDTIKVQYTGRLQNGAVFDKSPEGQPLEFIVGESRLIAGFHNAVEGMKLNEEKEVTIKADDAYGQRNENFVREFPRESLPKNIQPQKGLVIKLQDSTGRTIPGIITDFNETTVTVDLNHPLAGKDLIFNIKVMSIE